MKITKLTYFFIFLSLQMLAFLALTKISAANADTMQEVYQLNYVERESGIDDYSVVMLVSDRYIRIDETGEDSGYIIYDDKNKNIYSVAHQDRSILVIKNTAFSKKDSPVQALVEYLQLADAPAVSGKNIYNYRVYVKTGSAIVDEENTCTEIQLVEDLLPEVRRILQNYQKVVSGQQIKMVDNKLNEMRDACFYADQVYNDGAYYEKGLPIQEWHSNERLKILTSYKKVKINAAKFDIPEDYRQFSIGENPVFELQ